MNIDNYKQNPLINIERSNSENSWFSKALELFNIEEKAGWPDAFGDALIKWNTEIKQPIRVLSLFSGAGGLDIGFHDAGFSIVECNEIEEKFTDTLIANSKPGKRFSGTNIVCLDIREYNPSINDIDFIIGGPPCQSFSAAGARAAGVNGTDDARGNLFWEYARLLKKIRPKGFLFENVYRIIGAQGGKPWQEIQEAFKELGYSLFWRILDAADYGVPQFRERLIIVGLREGSFKFPFPSHGPDSKDQREFYSAGKAISSINIGTPDLTIGGRHGHLLNDIPPGLNYSFYTERLGHPKPIFSWRSKFSDYLYKADPDTCVRTIKAQGGQYTGPFHWENRRFSVTELKRLQTFPDNYDIVGNRQNIIHQIGNSVPPQLARILALSILQQVFNKPIPFEVQLMPNSYKLGFRARKNHLTKIYAKKASEAIARLPKNTQEKTLKSKGKIFGKTTNSFQLLQVTSMETADFIIEHSIQDKHWVLDLYELNNSSIIKYEISISNNQSLNKQTELQSILLRSFSDMPISILGLWKYLEILVKQHGHKDDLVQLFGYYQYKNNYSININFLEPLLSDQVFWKVFSQVSTGICVGKILPIEEISHHYKISNDQLISKLTDLKNLGYEIRNHNTNKQIRKGMILIPYSFPSLNERSLQRFTEL